MVIKSKFWYKRPDNLKGKTGKWSKWGGAAENDYKEQVKDWWYCQSCSEVQPEAISPFLVKNILPEVPDESIRVCPFCYAKHCIELSRRILQEGI